MRILMAPLEGVTDKCYRNCFNDHFPGLSATLTPFLPIPDRVQRVALRNLDDLCLPGESRVPEIPQLLVSEADSMLIAIEALKRKGFKEVNWNLGCPSKGVVRKGKGSGLLPRTAHILRVLEKVLPRTDMKLSLKVRLGLHHSDELFRLLPSLYELPLNRLILHPRLGIQMYKGAVDIDGFQKALDLYGKPICYNGDIKTLDDFLILKERFPEVEEWMIGRGLVADPFLLEKILKKPLQYISQSDAGTNPFHHKEFYDFLDDLLWRMKGNFSRDIALWNYFKGILVYSFSFTGITDENRNEFFKIKSEEEWILLKNKLEIQLRD